MNDNNSSQNSNALLIAIFIAILFIPWIINEYLLKYYLTAWYYVMYSKMWVIYQLTKVEIIQHNLGNIFFWVDWFIVGSKVSSDRLGMVFNDLYIILLSVDTSSFESIRNHFASSDGDLTNDFNLIGRFAIAVYFPFYLLYCLRLTYRLLTVKKFDTVFDLDQFVLTMAEGFPELLPVVYDNPLKYDLDEGHWRMSPKIYKYLLDNKCITEYIDDGKEMFRLNEDQLATLLVEQLGNKWQGFGKLNKNYRTIAAIALPMVNSPALGKKETYELIEALGFAYSSKPRFLKCLKKALKSTIFSLLSLKFYCGKDCKKRQSQLFSDLNWIIIGLKETLRQRKYKKISAQMVNKYISKYQNIDAVKNILNKHAYNCTVVSALIESARLGGVVPSCSSLWLKREDRNLFYVFNNLGRHVAWIEVVGFWSHYTYEKAVGAPYPYAKVQNGIIGIDDALLASFYNYEPLKGK